MHREMVNIGVRIFCKEISILLFKRTISVDDGIWESLDLVRTCLELIQYNPDKIVL